MPFLHNSIYTAHTNIYKVLGCGNLKRLFILFILLLITGCQSSEAPKKDTTNSITDAPHKHAPFHGVKDENSRVNVLVLGVDSRGEKNSRSDAIMIAQYNPKNQKAKLVSIMRDCYVKIPSYSKGYNKINMAYYLGGPELLRKTIKENFGIDVEHYMTIDFQGFVKIVDMVAPEGIEINVKQQIIEDMGLKLQPGRQRLHGKELLAYARFRHDQESDFGRVKRQQEVLNALKDAFSNKVSSLDGMFHLPSLGQKLLTYVDTDMEAQSMLSIGGSLLLNPITEVETMRIPINATYKDSFYQHAGTVLELDFAKNREALKEFIINEQKPVNELNK
jgi:LCP family protein required for cell wall assembly